MCSILINKAPYTNLFYVPFLLILYKSVCLVLYTEKNGFNSHLWIIYKFYRLLFRYTKKEGSHNINSLHSSNLSSDDGIKHHPRKYLLCFLWDDEGPLTGFIVKSCLMWVTMNKPSSSTQRSRSVTSIEPDIPFTGHMSKNLLDQWPT